MNTDTRKWADYINIMSVTDREIDDMIELWFLWGVKC